MYKTYIIGNLGRDVKVRHSENGAFLSFSVAVAQGDRTIWFDCTMDGDRPKLSPYLLKGTKIFCSGTQSSKIYRRPDGVSMISHNLFVDFLELCGGERATAAPPASGGGIVVDRTTGEILTPTPPTAGEDTNPF